MKVLLGIIIGLIFSFLVPQKAYAIVDPLSVPNNRLGIHITNESDIDAAANLVNTNGGDWGYVTVVIRQDEKDTKRWQKFFDQMREKHLIPIIRVATRMNDQGYWEIPSEHDIKNWIVFFESLNWVVKNRYIVIGNEPNHAKEWGNQIDPIGYARYLKNFSTQLKTADSDYFVLPAGFDASAPDSDETMSEDNYLRNMLAAEPDLFEYIDGWTSHSYPNPGFAGNVNDTGRGSIQTYKWELDFLSEIGVNKNLPVFITETGWIHDLDGKILGFSSADDVGDKLIYAFQNVWNDEKVVAVTPFLLSYFDEPFNMFSWKKPDGEFYTFYYELQRIAKTKGKPEQVSSATILKNTISSYGLINSEFSGFIFLENTGQSIWTKDNIRLTTSEDEELDMNIYLAKKVEPGEKSVLRFTGKAPEFEGEYNTKIQVKYDDEVIVPAFQFTVRTFEEPNAWIDLIKIKNNILSYLLIKREQIL